ncbi:phage head-tail connector protein [Gimesia aquarii]|uniref:Phage gp6-like head-tail connector protein n=1 Tax=Gimesia aquarii TaxID=2527964 RepID=A0A517WNL3_9PLAN|nr:phage head-tail connector protein [Gimesia aquarii]QDU06825.1 Phage gp6-like head-tail connector protein [Gimesia aquarii]
MALTSRANIKTMIGVDDTSLDNVIDLLIPQADAIIKGYLQRDVEQETYTEFYNGTGNQALILNQAPVQEIISVHEDRDGYYGDGMDAFPASTALTQGTDFVLKKDEISVTAISKSGILYRIGKTWFRPRYRQHGQLSNAPGIGIGNIKVSYIAGWSVVPTDIQFAANKLVISMLESRSKAGRLQSENIEDYSYRLANGEDEVQALDSVKTSLARYKRIVI